MGGGYAGELRSVLVVDDEPDLRESMRDLLEGIPKLRIFEAGSGLEGLQAIRQQHERRHRIDLVLTDYRMPGMNGLQFLEQVNAIAPWTQGILMTAFPEMRLALEAFQKHRVAQVLRKPFDPAEAKEVVEAILDKTFTAEQRAEAFRRSMALGGKGRPSG